MRRVEFVGEGWSLLEKDGVCKRRVEFVEEGWSLLEKSTF